MTDPAENLTDAISHLLEWVRTPGWLLDSEGRVVFANAPAANRCLEEFSDGRLSSRELPSSGLRVVIAKPAGSQLPPRLARVAREIARGKSDKEIALALDLSHRTVRTYVVQLLRRLGVNNRTQVAILLAGSD
ncbi:MAG: response regulator transcription factor [Polyangiaceae bacterium]|nr:response regulator transcription factor [Polyangiaceae bacterium]